MIAPQKILAGLELLIEQGAIAKTACSGSFLKIIRPLLDARVLVEERSGAGRRLAVRDAAALQNFCRHMYPNASASAEDSSRVSGVARFRDSKVFASDTSPIVLARAWSENALLVNDQAAFAGAATARHGAFAFVLRQGVSYSVHGTCALVENPAVFTGFERLGLAVDLAIYGQGRISNRLIQWLASMKSPEFKLLHFPDYDPVGLNEFERLRERLGERVHLHIPADLDQRFTRHANRTLLDKPNNRAILSSLRRSSCSEVRQVLALIDYHNAALEQEALLVR